MRRRPERNRRVLRSSNGAVRVEAVLLDWLYVTVYAIDGWPVRRARFVRTQLQLLNTLTRGGIDEHEATELAAEILRDPPRPAKGIGRMLAALMVWLLLAAVGAVWLLVRLTRGIKSERGR